MSENPSQAAPVITLDISDTSEHDIDMHVEQVQDVLLALVEHCVARHFDTESETTYKKGEYVVYDHRLWQFVEEYTGTAWNRYFVREVTLADEVMTIMQTYFREYQLVTGDMWVDGFNPSHMPISMANGTEWHCDIKDYDPGQKYIITTACRNNEAFAYVYYEPKTVIVGQQIPPTLVQLPAGLNGASFIAYNGSRAVKAMHITISGMTISEANSTSIYSVFPKNDLITGDFAKATSYAVYDYYIDNGRLYRQKGMPSSAGTAFNPNYAFQTTVMGEIKTIRSSYLGGIMGLFGVNLYTPASSFAYTEGEWYWQLGRSSVARAKTSGAVSGTIIMVDGRAVYQEFNLPTSTNSTFEVFTLKEYFENFATQSLAVNDAMVFKGILGSGSGQTAALPASHECGWTYKVGSAGTFAGQVCEVGDMVVCIQDGSTASDADWAVVQTNLNTDLYATKEYSDARDAFLITIPAETTFPIEVSCARISADTIVLETPQSEAADIAWATGAGTLELTSSMTALSGPLQLVLVNPLAPSATIEEV